MATFSTKDIRGTSCFLLQNVNGWERDTFRGVSGMHWVANGGGKPSVSRVDDQKVFCSVASAYPCSGFRETPHSAFQALVLYLASETCSGHFCWGARVLGLKLVFPPLYPVLDPLTLALTAHYPRPSWSLSTNGRTGMAPPDTRAGNVPSLTGTRRGCPFWSPSGGPLKSGHISCFSWAMSTVMQRYPPPPPYCKTGAVLQRMAQVAQRMAHRFQGRSEFTECLLVV